MLDACKESGVKHVVLNSALGAGDYGKSFPSWHRKVEDKLKATGMSYAILRPNGFLQNIVAYNAPSIRAQGAFYAAMGDAKVSYLDVGDIAVVAVKALKGGAHAGKTYELNGPEAISNEELAKRISKVTGRTVKYVDIPESAQREAMLGLGMPEWQVTALLELQQYYKQGGGARTDGLLRALIERDPVTLDLYLRANAREFRDQAASAWKGKARMSTSPTGRVKFDTTYVAGQRDAVHAYFSQFAASQGVSVLYWTAQPNNAVRKSAQFVVVLWSRNFLGALS
jgi:NmrA-like family